MTGKLIILTKKSSSVTYVYYSVCFLYYSITLFFFQCKIEDNAQCFLDIWNVIFFLH